MNAPANIPTPGTGYAPGTLGLPCKVAVNLDTGEWEIVGTRRTWTDATAIPVPPRFDGWLTFETVEGMARELATDAYEIGYFEGPSVPKEDTL